MKAHRKKGQRHRGRRTGARPRGPKREHVEELHPVEDQPEIESFAEWDLGEEVQRAIELMDITVPTPIQALSIGPVLEGRDVIAKAETGTGKTLAFGAPMMAKIDAARATVLGLVLCPTRELAQQVADVIAALALPRGVRVALVVGGDPMHGQITDLQAGAQVVVGTPGRVLDLAQQRFLSFPWTEFVVLDEADKMFEIGFLDDIKKILALTPEERQTLLFSATFPTEVLKLARSATRDPVEVATAKGAATVDSIEQLVMEVDDEDKALMLTRLFEQGQENDVFLVFCDRRTEVDRLMRRLDRLPFQIKALHGGYDQPSRFRVMSAFRTGEVKALVATDVASRGLDVQHVTHVVNYSVPRDLEDYTHRIGRTGRAGRKGTAITFVSPLDRRKWRALYGRMKWDVETIDAPGRHRGRARVRDREEDREGARDGGRRERGGRGRGGESRGEGRGDGRARRGEGRGRSDGREGRDDRGGRNADRGGRGRSGSRSRSRGGEDDRGGRRKRRGSGDEQPAVEGFGTIAGEPTGSADDARPARDREGNGEPDERRRRRRSRSGERSDERRARAPEKPAGPPSFGQGV